MGTGKLKLFETAITIASVFLFLTACSGKNDGVRSTAGTDVTEDIVDSDIAEGIDDIVDSDVTEHIDDMDDSAVSDGTDGIDDTDDSDIAEETEENSFDNGETEFYESWKRIYWDWVSSNENADGSSNLWENKEFSEFCFVDWEGHEAPVLCISTGTAYSDYDYYGIMDDQVVYLLREGKGALGYINAFLIDDTDYCIDYDRVTFGEGESEDGTQFSFDVIEASLYHTLPDGTETVWDITWYPTEPAGYESEVPLALGGNPIHRFYGEPMSGEEALQRLDEMLGEGAGTQIIDLIVGTDVTEINGPLSFVRADTCNGMKTWNMWMSELVDYDTAQK